MTSPEEYLQKLIEEQKSLQIASLTPAGLPYASYAPFVQYKGDFYIYISELAKHTKNLTSDQRISILIIEDEANARQMFARKRLTGEGNVTEVSRDEESYDEVVAVFLEKFGSIMNVLANLNDFRLFRVEMKKGGFVMGFGKAYTLLHGNVNNLVRRGGE